MLDRSANLRLIISGRGNSIGFTDRVRACNKKKAHKRMRSAAHKEIARQLEDMRDAYEQQLEDNFRFDYWCGAPDCTLCSCSREEDDADQQQLERRREEVEAEALRLQKLARRRELYRLRKIAKQIAQYEELLALLKKLDDKLDPEAAADLFKRGLLISL